MPKPSIVLPAVRDTLKQLGTTFRTKQLSQHPLMLREHAGLASHRNYHAIVGRFLAAHCDDVERLDVPANDQGVLWRNRLVGGQATNLDVVGDVESMTAQKLTDVEGNLHPVGSQTLLGGDLSFGPQLSGDDAFTARMRRHQSWYRATVLRVPFGTGPFARSKTPYGNMLTRPDAESGLNFLTPEIHRIALERLQQRKGAVEPFRLLHNMLSSQPFCFNLFGPLARDCNLATRLLETLPQLNVARVRSVALEFTPDPAEEYLGDGTAFDAFIDYERRDGSRAFLGVETKLTDTFSQNNYDSESYRRWMRSERSPWRADSATSVAQVCHNQLWRDHLLAIAMRDHGSSPYRHGALMLVGHPEDPTLAPIVAGYRRLLVDTDDTFIHMPLDRLVSSWRTADLDPAQHAWLDAIVQRYLDLQTSQS